MKRREMLKLAATLGVLPLVSGCKRANAALSVFADPISPLSEKEAKEMLTARQKARWRTRRIIMNNDGNDAKWDPAKPASAELFLSKRTLGLAGTHVDSIFYCSGVNNLYTHRSMITEPQRNSGKDVLIDALEAIGTDTLEVMVDFCKQHGKEIFWSMRMNDTHDSGQEFEHISKIKQNHPDWMVGKKGKSMPVLSGRWSAFDYGLDQVRRLAVNILTDVVTRYNVDGIELDFFRHPHYFRAQFYGEPVTQNDCDKMTGMIREIRTMCDREGLRRGRPVLIAIRVPDSFAFSKAIGLDWEQWLKEELIDVVTGADYLKFNPWSYLSEIGRKYNIPVYAGIEQRRMVRGNVKETEAQTVSDLWRGESYIAWNSGVNGIYTFNRFNPHDPLFRELGDPALLAKLSRVKKESMTDAKNTGMLSAPYWLKDGNDYLNTP